MDIKEIDYFFYTLVGHSLTQKEDPLWKRGAAAETVGCKLFIDAEKNGKGYNAINYIQNPTVASISFAANKMVEDLHNQMRRKNVAAS